MSTTTDSFVTQITNLATSFETTCAAAVLFYWGDGAKHGLRVEATTIMKEFVDNLEFGRDPEGILFYHKPSDFDFDDDDDEVTYKVYYNSETPKAIRIDFHPPGNDTTRFASFLTKDTHSVDSRFLSNGSGRWRNQKIGTSFATLHNISGNKTVTLKMGPIGKKATFSLPSAGDGFTVNGVFHFDKLTDLTGSPIANYDRDRLLFYPSSDKNTLTGVFFPTTDIPIDDHNLQNPPSATWENLK